LTSYSFETPINYVYFQASTELFSLVLFSFYQAKTDYKHFGIEEQQICCSSKLLKMFNFTKNIMILAIYV